VTLAPFDVVRAWFAAFNRGDLDALMECYAADIELDRDDGILRGRDEVLRALARHLSEREPALEEGARRRIRTTALVESGVSAEWVAVERVRASGVVEHTGGQDLFVVQQGRIVRQREVTRQLEGQLPDETADAARPSSRRYPERPIVGVGAVVLQEGKVLLIKRRFEPLAGQWSLPGGTLELGETLTAGIAREVLEETGLVIDVGAVLDVFDRILLDPDHRVRYHFVLIDYLCRPVGGRLQAGSDVADALFADPADLASFRMTPKTISIIERAIAMSAGPVGDPPRPPSEE
jgi:8-oxo-dGTP diphosphatase